MWGERFSGDDFVRRNGQNNHMAFQVGFCCLVFNLEENHPTKLFSEGCSIYIGGEVKLTKELRFYTVEIQPYFKDFKVS